VLLVGLMTGDQQRFAISEVAADDELVVFQCLINTNHVKFQLDRFRGFGASDGRKLLSPIDWRYHPYNSVCTTICTNVLHYDKQFDQQYRYAIITMSHTSYGKAYST